MNWARKLLIVLGIAFCAACMAVVLLFDWSVTGWKAYSVPTGSMRPHMPPGSLVLVHSVPAKTLKVGDVITYINLNKHGSTITHRIIKTYKLDGKIPAFVTKGDANPTADPPIVGGLVKGKAVWHMPFLGSLLLWGKGIVGLIILVYIPALLVTTEEVQRLAEYYRKMQPYIASGYHYGEKVVKGRLYKFMLGAKLSGAMVVAAVLIGFPVHALLKSNTVVLVNNRISVAPRFICLPHFVGSNNATVININNQSGTSGNVSANGNTSVNNVSSGSVSNSNSTNTSVNQTIRMCE